MSETAKKHILIRGFGNSGAGAVMDWLHDTNSYFIPKYYRFEEFSYRPNTFSIPMFLDNDFNKWTLLKLRLKILTLVFNVIIKRPIRKLLYLSLHGKVSRIHYSHSVEYSAKSQFNNLYYSFVFDKSISQEKFNDWFNNKINIEQNHKPIIFDQGLPTDIRIYRLLEGAIDFHSVLVLRNPIKIILQRSKTEKKLLEFLKSYEEYNVEVLELDSIIYILDQITRWYREYIKLIDQGASVLPISFDFFIRDKSYRQKIFAFLGHSDFNEIHTLFKPEESLDNDNRLDLVKFKFTNDSNVRVRLNDINLLHDRFDLISQKMLGVPLKLNSLD
jgi:hypothetical protein